MKFIIGIVSNEDAGKTVEQLSVNCFYVTKLSTSGQFLKGGNTTLLIGVEDEKVQNVIDVIRGCISKRTIVKGGVDSTLEGSLLEKSIEVTNGGATIFVLDVADFQKL